jgi:hypothetical protein
MLRLEHSRDLDTMPTTSSAPPDVHELVAAYRVVMGFVFARTAWVTNRLLEAIVSRLRLL